MQVGEMEDDSAHFGRHSRVAEHKLSHTPNSSDD